MTHRQSPFLRLDPVGRKRDLDDAGLLATTRSPRATAVQGCRRSPAHGSPPERAQTAASLPCWQRTHPLSPSSSQPTFIRPYRHIWAASTNPVLQSEATTRSRQPLARSCEASAARETVIAPENTQENHRNRALRVQEPDPRHTETSAVARVSALVSRVELRGFEPLTP